MDFNKSLNEDPSHADDESSIRPETKTGGYKTKNGKTSARYWRMGHLPSRQAIKQARSSHCSLMGMSQVADNPFDMSVSIP